MHNQYIGFIPRFGGGRSHLQGHPQAINKAKSKGPLVTIFACPAGHNFHLLQKPRWSQFSRVAKAPWSQFSCAAKVRLDEGEWGRDTGGWWWRLDGGGKWIHGYKDPWMIVVVI